MTRAVSWLPVYHCYYPMRHHNTGQVTSVDCIYSGNKYQNEKNKNTRLTGITMIEIILAITSIVSIMKIFISSSIFFHLHKSVCLSTIIIVLCCGILLYNFLSNINNNFFFFKVFIVWVCTIFYLWFHLFFRLNINLSCTCLHNGPGAAYPNKSTILYLTITRRVLFIFASHFIEGIRGFKLNNRKFYYNIYYKNHPKWEKHEICLLVWAHVWCHGYRKVISLIFWLNSLSTYKMSVNNNNNNNNNNFIETRL